jgi:hypothetical protein
LELSEDLLRAVDESVHEYAPDDEAEQHGEAQKKSDSFPENIGLVVACGEDVIAV